MQPPTVPGGAWTASILYSFPRGVQADTIIMSPGGVFYGTAAPFEGLTNGLVFQLLPPASSPDGQWAFRALHAFPPSVKTTGNPVALTFAPDGVLYGAAEGSLEVTGMGQGGVFQLTPPSSPGGSWTYALLQGFETHRHPNAPLVLRNGKLHGILDLKVSPPGGGDVFEMDPPSAPGGAWTTTYLHQFTDGQTPMYALIMGPAGTLYGVTTNYAVNANTGTVYSIQPR